MTDNPDDLVRKAHNKLSPGFFGKMFSSKESRVDEAMELLTAATNNLACSSTFPLFESQETNNMAISAKRVVVILILFILTVDITFQTIILILLTYTYIKKNHLTSFPCASK